MNDINRMRALAGLPILNESLTGNHLEALKNAAKKNSEAGYVQHINKDDSTAAGYYLSDWYDSDSTVYSYENGKLISTEAELDEGSPDYVTQLKHAARENSRNNNVQYISKDPTSKRGYRLRDTPDELTIYCFKNGQQVPYTPPKKLSAPAMLAPPPSANGHDIEGEFVREGLEEDVNTAHGSIYVDGNEYYVEAYDTGHGTEEVIVTQNGHEVCTAIVDHNNEHVSVDIDGEEKSFPYYEYSGAEELAHWAISTSEGLEEETTFMDGEIEEANDNIGSFTNSDRLELLVKRIGFGKTKAAIQQAHDADTIDDHKARELLSQLRNMYQHNAQNPAKFALESHDGEIEEARGKKEAIKAPFHAEEINALVPLSYEEAKPAALELINNSSTSPEKKAFLSRQIENNRKGVQGIVALLYNMLLSFEGSGVIGSRYGKRFEDAVETDEVVEDLQNGYNNRHEADEFGEYPGFGFPNGADGPVVKKTGAAGARQGDNPEQKKMAVTEDILSEMVHKYRNHLKESAPKHLRNKLNETPQRPLSVTLEDSNSKVEQIGDTLSYTGKITVVGTGLDVHGNTVDLEYTVIIDSFANITWEDDELPVDANSYNGSIQYTPVSVANIDHVSIGDVKFDNDDGVTIDGELHSIKTPSARSLLSVLHRDTVVEMLTNATYEPILQPVFEDAARDTEREDF